jgi:hypothetical protein
VGRVAPCDLRAFYGKIVDFRAVLARAQRGEGGGGVYVAPKLALARPNGPPGVIFFTQVPPPFPSGTLYVPATE